MIETKTLICTPIILSCKLGFLPLWETVSYVLLTKADKANLRLITGAAEVARFSTLETNYLRKFFHSFHLSRPLVFVGFYLWFVVLHLLISTLLRPPPHFWILTSVLGLHVVVL
jgi:hypothetical protein